MKTYEFTRKGIEKAVEDAILECATHPRSDVLEAIKAARFFENQKKEYRGVKVLDQLIENAQIAHTDCVPICQDTGSVWVRLEVGRHATKNVPVDILDGVDVATSRAYEKGKLRMSIVKDALFNRTNTKNNTPAFKEIAIVGGSDIILHVMLKGGGSDNASRVCMLAPSAGREGIKQEILKCVREKAANACPPLIIGVGIGATFDKVGTLAKHALLRPVSVEVLEQSLETEDGNGNNFANSNSDRDKDKSGTNKGDADNGNTDKHAQKNALEIRNTPDINNALDINKKAFEAELLEAVNKTGIGPGALGGSVTALGVHIESAPCHIAALPLAINMGCCAMRSASIKLST